MFSARLLVLACISFTLCACTVTLYRKSFYTQQAPPVIWRGVCGPTEGNAPPWCGPQPERDA